MQTLTPWPFPMARNTDPDTSHAAARKPRGGLRDRLWALFNEPNTVQPGTPVKWTGHCAAARLNAPLNSVTPRFAELRKLTRIKDSGERSDGQIVWVRA